ncbi:hypothetical protein ACIQVU_18110 [Lysinibacillus sp. NPDC098008]|uniref:hypothetical protein n=1 Tax=Lysinibacillus sp. NPDC098008 TaxID=3364146 RepID=UPI00380FCDDE
MLTDVAMLAGFCNRGRPSIGLPNRKRPKHFELLSFLHTCLPTELEMAIAKVRKLNEEMITTIVHNIPVDLMSGLDKEWVIRLLMHRKEWIINWYEGSEKV